MFPKITLRGTQRLQLYMFFQNYISLMSTQPLFSDQFSSSDLIPSQCVPLEDLPLSVNISQDQQVTSGKFLEF